MRIYYTLPDFKDKIEEGMDGLINTAKNTSIEITNIIVPFAEQYKALNEKYWICFFELLKYKIMWALRFIETEIDAEETGILKMTAEGHLEIIDFSPDLTEKIKTEFKERFKK